MEGGTQMYPSLWVSSLLTQVWCRILTCLQESLCVCSSPKDVSFNGTQDKECGARWINGSQGHTIMNLKLLSFQCHNVIVVTILYLLSPQLVSRLLPLGIFPPTPTFYYENLQTCREIEWILQQTPSDSAPKFFNLHFTLLALSCLFTSPPLYLSVNLSYSFLVDFEVIWRNKHTLSRVGLACVSLARLYDLLIRLG